ncbi:hypothetical protein HOP50_15g75980 [Chloropicon primus]|uniref:Uncharacterized protein n=1 Tax=Chloropicon primus TaxID=1764295 RepID=A0A5B8MWY7_9CHLO|nr:hypothetical protein A3770_15p75710 [Chloropicon primus]UPR04262.1 hypothetical protein HOP50_15g75980 [Chloropicon primus]|eukprot:QDZ25053.1 hypothetical protein A3770_15p75710 [Chloropicon primus]
MPESHLGTTMYSEHHVIVTMYSARKDILYEVDGSGTWTKYTEEVVISEPGVHTVIAVSVDGGIHSENSTAVYKVAAVAKGAAYDGYLDHCTVGLDLDADLEIDSTTTSSSTSLDSFGRAYYKLTSLSPLVRGFVMLLPDHPKDCVCGVPKPTCCCDKSVGIPQMLYLRTPSNATQLNPATTILSQMLVLRPELSLGEAQDALKAAWDMPRAYDVVGDDILWLSLNSYLDVQGKGPRSFVRMAQIEVLACCVAMTLAGSLGVDWPDSATATSVYSAIAQATLEASAPLDLASKGTTEKVVRLSSQNLAKLPAAALNATSEIVSRLSSDLVRLLHRYEDEGEASASDFSLPVEIAAVSREANTEIGRDLNLVAATKLPAEDFERKHLVDPEHRGGPQPPKKVVTLEGQPPSELEAPTPIVMPSKPANQSMVETWQFVLIGGIGAPILFLLALYVARRKRKGEKDQLLNLVERHNLLGGPDEEEGRVHSSSHHDEAHHRSKSTTSSSSSSSSSTSTGKAKAKAKTKPAPLSQNDAFGSPQRIRHRPPKSASAKQERQTLLYDHQRQTWHMPIEVPAPPSNLSTPEESPRSPSGGQILHAIEEQHDDGDEDGDGAGDERPTVVVAVESRNRNPLHKNSRSKPPRPPPPANANVFIRKQRLKLYKPKQ